MSNTNHTDQISLRWQTAIPAIILVLLSTVTKLKIGSVEFSGGSTLAVIAGVLLLWPVIRQLANRGGSTEFLGLKLQMNSLERITEQDHEIRFQELRSDIEDLRQQITEPPEIDQVEKQATDEIAESELVAAIADYQSNRVLDDWKERVITDKRLASGKGRLPIERIRQILNESLNDQETQMAIAVSLGVRYPHENDLESAQLLVSMLTSPFERVRFRAARSITRRAARTDTSPKAYEIMLDGVREALRNETSSAILRPLKDAHEALFIFTHSK